MTQDITIKVSNRDAGKQYILVFQKPEVNYGELYTSVFPVAWKVIPLHSGASQYITYPSALEIMVKESGPSYTVRERGFILESSRGQLWRYANNGIFNFVEKVQGAAVDGLLGCRNEAPQRIDVGVAKNGAPLVMRRRVALGDQVNIKLIPRLYFAYASDMQVGELIKLEPAAAKIHELDLTNLKSAEIELAMADHHLNRKQWRTQSMKWSTDAAA